MTMRKALLVFGAAVLAALAVTAVASAGSMNGSAGQMPALYDGQQFTINFKEEPGSAEQALLAHNGSINTIYMCDSCHNMITGGDFTSVLDAIQGDGFNPLWQEVQVSFTTGHTPVQRTADTEILADANAGIITLSPTTEVYRCAVVGTKK
jgi:hypothetical protein